MNDHNVNLVVNIDNSRKDKSNDDEKTTEKMTDGISPAPRRAGNNEHTTADDNNHVPDMNLNVAKSTNKTSGEKLSSAWKMTSRSNQLASTIGVIQYMVIQVAKDNAKGIPRTSNHVNHSFLEGKFGPNTCDMVIAFQVTNLMYYEMQDLHRHLHGAIKKDDLLQKVEELLTVK